METNTCRHCHVEKPASEFYVSDRTACKDCTKERVRKNRAEKADYYRAYDSKRFKEDPRVRERHKRYQSTEAGKASLAKSRNKYYSEHKEEITASRLQWISKNKHKREAHIIVGNSVRSGRLVKPSNCEECGNYQTGLHGHHEDYGKPLEVIWLCAKCHSKRHRTPKV